MVMYAGRLVEVAGREALFCNPAHPTPVPCSRLYLDVARRQPLQAIAGHAPALGQRPHGCAFAPRCDRHRAECSVIEPRC
jgi:peptide/nickel transport system ATP-binding protein